MLDDDSPRIPGNIVFIEIPSGMAKDIGAFSVDPSIPIPVELGPDAAGLSGLSWEMLVAGMLRLLAYDPGNAHASYYRGFVLAVKPEIFVELSETGILKARNGDLDVAEEVFKALGGLAPEAPEPVLNLAILYEDKADALDRSGKEELAEAVRGKAFDAYKRLMSMDPVYPDAYFNAGFFYSKNRSYDQAARMFEAYIEVGDDEEKLDKAKEIVGKLRVRGDADAKFKEAYDFIRMGKEEDGIARASEFVRSDPGVWNGWFLVGWGNRRLGRYAEGREAFLKALELGAEEVDVLNELAICEMELGLLAESRGRLERALRKEPENIKIISNLGVVARKQGRDAEAAGFYRTVLELEPGDQLALSQLEELDD
ncbi:MAG: tetratricopeptide repeat protein [Spirochaetes bacterium]|nr:tetratricopeptide repeat protein [Spirochaetota bacterium]MBU1079560.1 tetratricopeptide repeat protein [Spirochaetota bacterium]